MATTPRDGRSVLQMLVEKPPTNAKTLYKILTAGVKEILDSLVLFEQQYYGKGKTGFDDMRKWRNHIRNIVAAFRLGSYRSATDMEAAFKRSTEADCPYTFDVADMNKVKEVHVKIKSTIVDGGVLANLFANAQLAFKYLLLYGVSFYVENDLVVLETADKYEKQRRGLEEALTKHLSYLDDRRHKFLHGELQLADLAVYGTELVRRSECYFAPVLALVPEACENLRQACAAMGTWISADSVYGEFIGHDITELETKYKAILASKRRTQQLCHQLAFRLQRAEAERDNQSTAFYEMELSEKDLIIEVVTIVKIGVLGHEQNKITYAC